MNGSSDHDLSGTFSKYRILHARYIAEHDGLRQEYRVSPITCSHSRRCDVPAEEYIYIGGQPHPRSPLSHPRAHLPFLKRVAPSSNYII